MSIFKNLCEKRLLVVGYVWPEPKSSAAGTRMLQLLHTILQAGYSITYASAAAKSIHRVTLADIGIEELVIALNDESFDAQVEALAPQVVIFDRFFTEEQFGWRVAKVCPDALQILDTEDLHSLRAARQRELKRLVKIDSSVLSVSTDTLQNADWMKDSNEAHREIASIMRVDITLMISPFEVDLLTQHFNVPAASLFYFPLLIEKNNPSQQEMSPFHTREHFISIGNFRHEPNWDAVLYLKEHIWPDIRKALPQAQLHVYGAYPPPKATQLHNAQQGFLVKGWAEDAFEVMSRARVLLAPLRFGAGVKGKLVDAFQTQIPSVTTTIGSEGLLNEDDNCWPGKIAAERADFIQAAITLYTDESTWNAASHQCEKLTANFTDFFTPDFISHLETLHANLAEHRRNNFWGTMLKQEMLQSAKYKGLWIEAKNRQ